ncbi:calcium-binding protein [Rhodobacteraceae bacterium R_SAG9]|nr:calcium-binding protein [Rhodobacteraceae bacterium R_SAG9]
MLAILAITAIFGVGMVADMLNGYELPEQEPEDLSDEVEDEEADVGFMPNQQQILDAVDATTLSGADDIFDGGDANDTVIGGAGDDELRGNNGVDWLDGRDGNDTLIGGASSDALSGGAGDDYILGGAGEDAISGGAGNDTIVMGENDDIYDGVGAQGLGFEDSGDDLVRGGEGDDFLRDYDGADTLLGGTGNDTIIGSHPTLADTDADVLHGGFGTDLLIGDNGDTLAGGDGVDNFGVAFELGEDRDEVVITDLDAATETVTFAASDFGSDAVMEWEASYDAESEAITILLSGSHTVDGSVVTLDQEPAVILENMTADDVDLLKVSLDYAA